MTATAMLATVLLAAKLLPSGKCHLEVAPPNQVTCMSQRPQAVQRVATAASASLAPDRLKPFRPTAPANVLGTAVSYQINLLARNRASAQAGAQLQAWLSSPTLTHSPQDLQIQQVLPWPHALKLQPMAILSKGTTMPPKSP